MASLKDTLKQRILQAYERPFAVRHVFRQTRAESFCLHGDIAAVTRRHFAVLDVTNLPLYAQDHGDAAGPSITGSTDAERMQSAIAVISQLQR